MLTLPGATRILMQAQNASGLAAVAYACGFVGDPAPLDAASRAALGLPASVRVATVVEGRGVLRALCVELPRGSLTRENVGALTVRLQRRSPFALWLVLAAERGGTGVAVASALVAPRPGVSLLCLSRAHIVDSDAETLRALSAASAGLDILVHARWCEVLGREALTQRFFRALERTVAALATSVAPGVPDDDARTLAILTSTRFLFLSFLEAKGWLNGDHGFLRRTWDACTATRGGYHRNVILPLCFGTLNTPRSARAPAARAFGDIPFLNGGLFTRTPLERRYRRATFSDDALGALVSDLLGRWRFTVRENHTSHAEAAVDPEMLGRAFECLMASRERRASGSFYTPRVLVARVFDAALDAALSEPASAAALTALRAGVRLDAAEAGAVGLKLASLRVLDPACGSGAFLVHTLEELATLRARCSDTADTGALRRDILARQLFGVDREATAVWLCELRLWLAVVVETATSNPRSVPPLPNLDAQVRVGDALAGDAFAATTAARRPLPLARLRERYARATGTRKRTLSRTLHAAERAAAGVALNDRIALVTALRREIVVASRGRDLFGERVRPDAARRARLDELRRSARELRAARFALLRGGAVAFDFAAQFADVGASGGFDIVVGNPPWVRLHRIPIAERARLRSQFVAFRDAGWRAGAEVAGAGAGFAAQVDLAALFVERSLALVREGGTISLLVPAKLWRSLAGGGIRHLLLQSARIVELEDWTEARATFDAAVYPSLIVASRGAAGPHGEVRMSEHHRDRALQWTVARAALPFDSTPGAPWLWLPADPRAGFDRVAAMGTPLAQHAGLRPRLGVKCGFNEAYIVDDALCAAVEHHLLRPLLRGEAVTPWSVSGLTARIIFPHDASLHPLRELPPLARKWLAKYQTQLTARSDLRGRAPWWSLFRVEGADARRPRVVWADLSRSPRAAVLEANDPTVPLNSCYVVPTSSIDEAHALAAWLNGPIAAAWLAALAEPARGGFRRMLGWTVGLLPIPRDWDRAVEALAPCGARAARGDVPSAAELLDVTLETLGVAAHDVEALLTWGHR